MKTQRIIPLVRKSAIASGLVFSLLSGCAVSSPSPSEEIATTTQALPLSVVQKTAAFGWGSSISTTLTAGTALSGPFSITARYMPQYENSYEGPIVASSDDSFYVGLADYDAVGISRGANLVVHYGGQTAYYTLPNPLTYTDPTNSSSSPSTRPIWRHLGVVSDGTTLTVYADGVKLCGITTCTLDVHAAAPPIGTIQLGKRKSVATRSETQFYGFIDDVGFFSRALPATEVAQIAASAGLTGSESKLTALYGFDAAADATGPAAATYTLQGSATLEYVTTTRNAYFDRARLPAPVQTIALQLPFSAGETWTVLQGIDDPAGSHDGYAAFCWDFIRATTVGSSWQNQANTKSAVLKASAAGTVAVVNDSGAWTANGPANRVQIKHGPGFYTSYLHMLPGTAPAAVTVDAAISAGAIVGLAGDIGVRQGAYHLHFGAIDHDANSPGARVTFPVAFSNYEASDDQGVTWYTVSRGIPRRGQWIRRQPTPQKWDSWLDLGGNAKDAPAAVMPTGSVEDIFIGGTDDRLWQKTWTGSAWSPSATTFSPFTDGFVMGSSPSVITNGSSYREVFARGTDGGVYHRTWTGSWNGWYGLGGQIVGAPAALMATSSVVDVFARGTDNRLLQKTWNGGAWVPANGWTAHTDGFVMASSPAVVGSGAIRDVYALGTDGAVYHKNGNGSTWSQWYGLGGFFDGAPTVVKPTPSTIEVFARGIDGKLYQKRWTGSQWLPSDAGWYRQDDLQLGSAPAAVTNGAGFLDVFARGTNGHVLHRRWF